MPASKDPTDALRQAAAALPNIIKGTSCNQTSFKVGKKAVLYVGPGAKGVGFKTMFKLSASLEEARELANAEPDRFEVGSGNWVTVRFSTEKPLPKKIWGKWLKESHAERWLVGNRRNLRRESRTHFKPADGDFDQRFVACRLIATGF